MLYEATKPGSVCPLFCLIVVVERVLFCFFTWTILVRWSVLMQVIGSSNHTYSLTHLIIAITDKDTDTLK